MNKGDKAKINWDKFDVHTDILRQKWLKWDADCNHVHTITGKCKIGRYYVLDHMYTIDMDAVEKIGD